VTFTVTVTSPAGVPNGAVMFKVNDKTISSVALSNGIASFTYTFKSLGTYSVMAQYNGTTNYQGASATISQVVR
jgi:hypothetical protein